MHKIRKQLSAEKAGKMREKANEQKNQNKMTKLKSTGICASCKEVLKF